MKKIFGIIAAAFLVLAGYQYAHSAGPTQTPVEMVQKFAEQEEGTYVKATEAEAKALDEKQARPVEGSEMFFLTIKDMVTICLVVDNVVVFTSNAIPLAYFNQIIGKTGA